MEPVAQVTVTLLADGRVNVQTAGQQVNNKVMLLGLLELAKGAILAPPPQQPAPPSLLIARGGLPPINGKG